MFIWVNNSILTFYYHLTFYYQYYQYHFIIFLYY